MNRSAFYKAARSSASGIFGTSLSTAQVQGCEAILDACEKYAVKDQHHVAHILAEVYHETGRYMLPIKETVMPSHKDKNPSDATVIKRLDTAFASGRLPWVRTPYWRDGWFGRGPIQTTHRKNYEKVGAAIGVDLVNNRDRILEPAIGAASAVVGLRDGLYTGRKLADYSFPAALDADPDKHPRRMVNGQDGTDANVSKYHRAFYSALTAAGYSSASPDAKPVQAPPKPAPAPQPARIEPQPVSDGNWLSSFILSIAKAFRK